MASSNQIHDIVIIGAGISGVNAAYRVQTTLPNHSYTILESRSAIGGTWDFFKYPGIRSDSDMHTFGFPFQPWQEQKSIASGNSICAYIRDTAKQYGIDKHVEFNSKVTDARFSSQDQRWRLSVQVDGEKTVEYTARYILLCSGYYDYEKPLPSTITGLENFQGTIIHPQFWPSDLDYTNKNIAIVGSGATAVTLLPSLAERAAHVTMIQRSPGYLITLPNRRSPLANFLHWALPTILAQKLIRIQFLLLPFLFFKFCRGFPNAARKVMQRRTERQLPKTVPHDPHFHPAYNPWEQRLCACPDGDFFETLHSERASIATGQIDTMTSDSILMQPLRGAGEEKGKRIPADIIVTATGLKIRMAGGIVPKVDGQDLKIGEKFIWKGMMLQDLPNCAFVIGYTNASWTLGADAAAQHFCRIVRTMEAKGKGIVVPRVQEGESMTEAPVLNLNSTYVKRAEKELPKVSDRAPWLPRQNYFTDLWDAKYGDLGSALEFVDRAEEAS